MDAQAIDGHTRQDLWDRLEQADYFDWCRKEELKQLRALFFEGKVVEGAYRCHVQDGQLCCEAVDGL